MYWSELVSNLFPFVRLLTDYVPVRVLAFILKPTPLTEIKMANRFRTIPDLKIKIPDEFQHVAQLRRKHFPAKLKNIPLGQVYNRSQGDFLMCKIALLQDIGCNEVNAAVGNPLGFFQGIHRPTVNLDAIVVAEFHKLRSNQGIVNINVHVVILEFHHQFLVAGDFRG